MKLTRQHFQLIADIIAGLETTGASCDDGEYIVAVDLQELIGDMTAALSATNPHFNRERFIDAATKGQSRSSPSSTKDDSTSN